MQISSCTVSVFVGLALLGGSLLTMTVSKAQHERLKQTFSAELDEIYDKIATERRNQYLQGLLLGMIIATLIIKVYSTTFVATAHRIATFIAITLFVTVAYYTLMPKTDYMLNHLRTPEENRAWLEMYKTMRSKYIMGMLLGAAAAIPMANAFCK